MKVLMLTNVLAPDKAGGLERYVRELAAELSAAGDQVVVAAKALSPESVGTEISADGVEILRYPVPAKSRMWFALLYPLAVYRGVSAGMAKIARDKTATVHAHFPVPAILLLARRRQYVYTFHAPVHKELLAERQSSYVLPPIVQRLAVRLLRIVESQVLRHARFIVCLSEFTSREAVSLGAPPDRIRLIPGGISITKLKRDAPHVVRYGISGPKLFTARRLVSRTGVEELVRSMPLILRDLPNATLIIAGDGPRRTPIEACITELGLSDHVVLLGRVSEQELNLNYQQADICVTPTQELEGFGLATAEALASGACPLVTPIGANEEVVQGLGPLCVTDGASPEDLARGVVRLWNDANARAYAHSHAPAVASRFDWSVVVAELQLLYSASTP